MPQPTAQSVHIDAPLTNLSVAFLQSQSRFIASRVFPVVPVDKQSDKYFTFDRNNFFMDQMRVRAPGTESAGSGYTVSNDSYSCDVWALHQDVPDQVRQNTDMPLNPDRNATQFMTQQALLRLEKQWASDYFKSGVWTTDLTPASLWSDYTSSDPIGDIRTGVTTILQSTGFLPNRLVLGFQVYQKLQDHPDIIDRIKYSGQRVATADLMAELFEVEQVLVAQAVNATNLEGETAAYDFIAGKSALLCYAAPNAGLEVPTAGYTFMWRGVSEGLGANVAVSRFRMEHLKSDRLEIEAAWDNKVVSADLGYMFNSVIA
ncbi:MAG: hypothetical protein KGL39_22680 [Patescibacteria group bacterium]|nr:hypothetical protein [Patescibacteria group bacterium]